jgi:hypothetical protein
MLISGVRRRVFLLAFGSETSMRAGVSAALWGILAETNSATASAGAENNCASFRLTIWEFLLVFLPRQTLVFAFDKSSAVPKRPSMPAQKATGVKMGFL